MFKKRIIFMITCLMALINTTFLFSGSGDHCVPKWLWINGLDLQCNCSKTSSDNKNSNTNQSTESKKYQNKKENYEHWLKKLRNFGLLASIGFLIFKKKSVVSKIKNEIIFRYYRYYATNPFIKVN